MTSESGYEDEMNSSWGAQRSETPCVMAIPLIVGITSKMEQFLVTCATQEGFLQKASFGVRPKLGSLLGLLSCVPWVSHGPSLNLDFFPVRKVSVTARVNLF